MQDESRAIDHDAPPPDEMDLGTDPLDAEQAAATDEVQALALAREQRRNQAQIQRTARRDDEMQWRPTGSVTVVDMPVTLFHHIMQRHMSMFYGRAQRALHTLVTVAPFVLDSQAANDLEDMVVLSIDTLAAEVDNEIKRFDAMFEHMGLRADKKATEIKHLNAPRYTPYSGKLVSLMERIDHLFWQVDVLWITGSIRNPQKISKMGEYKGKLAKLVALLGQYAVRAQRARSGRERERLIGQGVKILAEQKKQAARVAKPRAAASEDSEAAAVDQAA